MPVLQVCLPASWALLMLLPATPRLLCPCLLQVLRYLLRLALGEAQLPWRLAVSLALLLM